MQTERWMRLEHLFAEALALPASERAAFLQHACGNDAALRDELDALLRSHEARGVLDAAPQPTAAPPASLAIGANVGVWRIEGLIGRGGMGEVYSVLRADAGFGQRAALKLLRFEAGGQLARFHAERRILARLEHPGIARLLDGGEAPDGRPYTVMEYVEGRSLTDHCREHDATLAERLGLFAQVCDAVAFAHRMLVVHRDLKPANTLVDATGRVKLLDFGIAKLLDVVEAGDAEWTVAPFTPDYAAPEQISGQPVTTATDVYALGVLLFELLTGERPLRMRGLPSAYALLAQFEQTAPIASAVAQANADAPLPAGMLKGDLDAIVAKCLRREPSHRYETVDGLKRDLQRHLAREPVLAREGARLYVVGRLLRRYRWAVAAAGALVFVLAAGLAGTAWQARRANMQASRATAVQDFLLDIFQANSSAQNDPVKARRTSARELLDIGARKIEGAMVDTPEAKLALLDVLARLYDDLALQDERTRLRSQAVELVRARHGSDSPELALALAELASAMYDSGRPPSDRAVILAEAQAILDRRGDERSSTRAQLLRAQAEHLGESDLPRALDAIRRSIALYSAGAESTDLAQAWHLLARLQRYAARPGDAVESLDTAIDVTRRVAGPRAPFLIPLHLERGSSLKGIEAESNARRTLELVLAINGTEHLDAARARHMLGQALFRAGKWEEALRLLGEARDLVLRLRGPGDPVDLPQILHESGRLRALAGLLAEGRSDIEEALAMEVRHGDGPLTEATMRESLASVLIEMGDPARAAAELDLARDGRLRLGQGSRSLNRSRSLRIRIALDANRFDDARAELAQVVLASPGSAAEDDAIVRISNWLFECEIALAEGEPARALALAERARAAAESAPRVDARWHATSLLLLGQAELADRRPQAALPHLRQALEERGHLFAHASPKIAEAQVALARAEAASGDLAAARTLLARATAIHGLHPRLSERYRQPLRELEGQLTHAPGVEVSHRRPSASNPAPGVGSSRSASR